jgi:diaminopimelate decarboxylase
MMLLGTQRINGAGRLEIGGCDAVELAERFGTPLYVMDEAEIRSKCRLYRQALEQRYDDVVVAFAGKAFLTLGMCSIAQQEGLALDVASGGELFTAIRAAFPTDRIYLHGNYKTDEELRTALAAGVGLIVVDSRSELDQVQRVAKESGRKATILLRVTPGIEPDTHSYVQTGQIDSKFVLGIETGEALAAAKHACSLPDVQFVGIHCHIGSSIYVLEPFEIATSIMVQFAAEVKRETGIAVAEINMGGGLGVRYKPGDSPPSIDDYADVIVRTLRAETQRLGLPLPRLSVEPGRGIVGEAGTILYCVGVVKEIPGVRTYVSVDGGLSDNPRPALYQARHNAILASRPNDAGVCRVTIAGRHCETDTLIPDIEIPLPKEGDILAVQTTGAYCYSMASNYNRFARPAVVLVGDGKAEVIVERETPEDLISHDRLPGHLKS